MSDLDPTPKKKQRTKLRRSYAISDIAPLLDEHEPIKYKKQSQPESNDDHVADDEDIYKSTDNEPTPKKRKAPVREAINASRKENGPHKVSGLIVIDDTLVKQ